MNGDDILTNYEEAVRNLRDAYEILFEATTHCRGVSANQTFRCQCAVKDALDILEHKDEYKWSEEDGAVPYTLTVHRCGWCSETLLANYSKCPNCGKKILWAR